MNIDINNSIIILFIFVENISLYTIKNPIFNDLLLNISYLFSNFHYLEGSLIDSNIHSIMEKDLNKPSLMTQPGNDGDPDSSNENGIERTRNGSSNNNHNEPVNYGNNSESNMENAEDHDEDEEDDVDVENLLDNVEDLLEEAKVTKKECDELEEEIEKVANDYMDEIISDTGNSKSLKRSREDDSDDEAPARKVYKHMEGSHSEILSDLESKKNTLRGIEKSLNSALKEVGDVYNKTEFEFTKKQISDFIDDINIPQEKKDAVISKDHSASHEAEAKGKGPRS
jgi:peptidoglycan hydrolase CwlO-like protein